VAGAAILVVDDDAPIRRMLSRTLAAEGYAVEASPDGGAALAAVERSAPDLVVLDVAMPGIDGLAVARRLRTNGLGLPILLLTARDGVPDRVAGLDAGGDDYLVKPFAFGELMARLDALMRRSQVSESETTLAVGDLTLDLLSRKVTRGERAVNVKPREFKLLEYLMRHADQVVTRTMLLENVWDYHFDPQTNVVDVHISRLRQQIDAGEERLLLKTIRNAGYMLTARD
jgi:two-component system, OmpR family, response regulator